MVSFFHRLLTRLRALVRRDVVADEISEELRFHVEQRTSELERKGLSHDDAERRARARFGNIARLQDEGYDVRGGGFIETVWQDVRYSARLLRRQPAFATVAIGTFAIGIGAAAALFGVMDAALLRPLPFSNPDQLVSVDVNIDTPKGRAFGQSPSLLDARQWRSLPVVSDIALLSPAGIAPDSGTPERLSGQSVSEGYFEMLGVSPVVGRTFSEEMTRAGSPKVGILGFSYWQRRFNADPLVVGRSIGIGRESLTIIGVLPEGFARSTDIWLPIRQTPSLRGFTAAYARLRDGVSLDVAQREWTAALERSGDRPAGASIRLTRLSDEVSRGSRKTVNTLAAGVGLILLIACANVAGLLLARGSTRGPELVVRASMGAGRGRLVRQLLTEAGVIASAGTLGGLFVAWLSLDAIVALVPLDLPDSTRPTLNWLVIGLTSATAFATTLAFGLIPARRLSRDAATSFSAAGNRRVTQPLTKRTGQVLIAIELALAVVLLSGAGLLLRSLDRLLSVDLGFDPHPVITVRAAPSEPTPESLRAYYSNFLDAVRQMPGVAAAGATDCVPLRPCGRSTNVSTPGTAPRMFGVQYVLPGYFETLGLVARAGRLLESGTDAGRVVLDETAASLLFPDSGAVGRTVTVAGDTYEVVGVVGHVKRGGALRNADRPNVYQLLPATHNGALDVVVRRMPGVTIPVSALRALALDAGPRVLIDRIGSGADLLADNVKTPRNRTVLMSLLGGLGLFLTLVGIASVTAYSVARRTREIGVRMTFGAAPQSVVWTMLRDAAWPMMLGLAVGVGASFYATKLVASFLFETTPTDPATFIAAALLLAATSAIAAWLPARRAASVDPVMALRSE